MQQQLERYTLRNASSYCAKKHSRRFSKPSPRESLQGAQTQKSGGQISASNLTIFSSITAILHTGKEIVTCQQKIAEDGVKQEFLHASS